MTKFETLTHITNVYMAMEDGEAKDAVLAYCSKELDKLNASIERAERKRAEKQAAEAPLLDEIRAMLCADPVVGDPIVASEVSVALNISTPKATALLKQLVAGGEANQTEVKRAKGSCKGYTKA